MRFYTQAGYITGLLSIFPAACWEARAEPPPTKEAGPPTVTMTTSTRLRAPQQLVGFTGTVKAVDRQSITVQGISFGLRGRIWKELRDYRRRTSTQIGWPLSIETPERTWTAVRVDGSPDGLVLTAWDGTRTEVRLADQPLRKFMVGYDLAAGEWFDPASVAESYRLGDVRVGDVVDLGIGFTDGPEPLYNWCRTISIRRRPGGKVPPAPAQDPGDRYQFHEHMQAFQDWEEKGAAFPYKYHPGWPVPQIASEPREAKPK